MMTPETHPHAYAATNVTHGRPPSLRRPSTDATAGRTAAREGVSTIIRDMHANMLFDPSATAATFDFDKRGLLGRGAFGEVWVCQVRPGAVVAIAAPRTGLIREAIAGRPEQGGPQTHGSRILRFA